MKLTRFRALCFFAFLTSITAEARWKRWEEAPFVLLERKENTFIGEKASFVLEESKLFQLRNISARESLSVHEFRYTPEAEKFEILEAWVENRGVRMPIPKNAIEERSVFSSEKSFDDDRLIKISVPGLEVGSKIFIKTRRDRHKPLVEGLFYREVPLGYEHAAQSRELIFESVKPLKVQKSGDASYLEIQESVSEKGLHVYKVHQKKPAIFDVVEELSPFYPDAHIPTVVVASVISWNEIVQKFLPRYDEIFKAPLPAVLQKIVEKARKKKTQVEQVNVVMSELAASYRYFGDYRTIDGGYFARPLSLSSELRSGDCKDFSVSTVAMLRRLGIEADPALIQRKVKNEPWIFKLPNINYFDHMIVNAKIDGKNLWLDPTNATAFAPYLHPELADRPSLILRKTSTDVEQTPPMSESGGDYLISFKHLGTSEFDSPIEASMALGGSQAVDWWSQYWYRDPSELEFALASYVSNNTAKKWKVDFQHPKNRISTPLKFKVRYESDNPISQSSLGPIFWIEAGSGLERIFAIEANRVTDYYLGPPIQEKLVDILEGVEVQGQLPAPCEVKSPWMDANWSFENQKGRLEVKRTYEWKSLTIPREEFSKASFKDFQKKLRGCSKKFGVIYKRI